MSELGEKMGTAGLFLGLVYVLIRPPRPARYSAPGSLDSAAGSFAGVVRAALGKDPEPPRPVCGAECWWPIGGKEPRWSLIVCPLFLGHPGMHADANNAPAFTDEDAAWLNAQHQLTTW